MSDDERPGLRRIVQTSDGSFPVVKVNRPLLSVAANDAAWNTAREKMGESEKIKLLVDCVDRYRARPWSEVGHNWSESLGKAELLAEELSMSNDDGAAMVTLARRFQTAIGCEDTVAITTGIVKSMRDLLVQGRLLNIKVAEQLLIGKSEGNKISVLLVFDLDQTPADVAGVYSLTTWNRVAEVLPMNLADKKRKHEHRAGEPAFGGAGRFWDGPFPQVKLPVLNANFPLVSMASDGDKAKCNRRYGLTEYTVIPVSEHAARRMQDALTWIVDEDREGRTWRGVANGKLKKTRSGKKLEDQDLLIAYVEDKPQVDAKTASYVGAGPNVGEAKFEVDAKAIAAAFSADPQVRPQSKLHLFLIHKASEGQAQVAMVEAPTVGNVLSAAERWVKAVTENLPHVRLWLPAETRAGEAFPARQALPVVPYPDQVIRLLSHQWMRDGSHDLAIVGPSLSDVLNVMLRTEAKWEPAARRLLGLLIHRLTPLLIGVFGAKNAYGPRKESNSREPLGDYSRSSRVTALRAVAVSAILLDSFGYRKDEYMYNAPYQIGQVLALADTLHKDYCTVVRKGQLPNSLIGTALMRRALDNPASAIADLGERMMEYVRWAKTAGTPQDDGKKQEQIAVHEARKKLRQFEILAAALGAANLPTQVTDVEKAQLLLGFLASQPGVEDQNGKDDAT